MIKKKTIILIVSTGILCFIGGGVFVDYKNVIDFKLDYEIPKFNQRQNEIIKNTYSAAISLLDNPANCYIAEVIETDTKIVLGFSVLSRLQDGSSPAGNIISITVDGYYKIEFDKNYNLITDSISLAKQNP